VSYLPTLRLFFDSGVCNEYRLRDDRVEFRTGDGSWRVLDQSDINLHYRFNTEVARWLSRHSLEGSRYREIQLSRRASVAKPAANRSRAAKAR
jgi:hypothetical protein